MSQKIGLAAELKAKAHLITQGLVWIESNYRCRWGEIDLIMRDKNYLVFIEVRARQSSLFGGASASVTYHKQQKLIKTASFYSVAKKIVDKYPMRFDVLSMDGSGLQIEWLKNAFELQG